MIWGCGFTLSPASECVRYSFYSLATGTTVGIASFKMRNEMENLLPDSGQYDADVVFRLSVLLIEKVDRGRQRLSQPIPHPRLTMVNAALYDPSPSQPRYSKTRP